MKHFSPLLSSKIVSTWAEDVYWHHTVTHHDYRWLEEGDEDGALACRNELLWLFCLDTLSFVLLLSMWSQVSRKQSTKENKLRFSSGQEKRCLKWTGAGVNEVVLKLGDRKVLPLTAALSCSSLCKQTSFHKSSGRQGPLWERWITRAMRETHQAVPLHPCSHWREQLLIIPARSAHAVTGALWRSPPWPYELELC